MPKNKRQKYERVKQLPNVIMPEPRDANALADYPWDRPSFSEMPKVLELGCGKAEHSLAFAADHPNRLHIGVDYKSHRICVGAEKALARKLDNLFFLRARIEQIHDYFAPGSVSEIWLTFPDPHLKNRKIKSRLTAPSFLNAYGRLLVPGGTVHLKTDSQLLVDYTRQTLGQHNKQILIDGDVAVEHGGVSAYEKAALDQGLRIHYLVFQLA